MCGFAGFLTAGGEAPGNLEAVATRMALAIRHRGPDDAGAWADVQAGIALGHQRLSIVDLSPAGHQPMVSACGRFVIAFNGEIYNHLDLRAELQAGDVAPAWRGHSDTETLLAAFAHWGVKATLHKTVGMFAIALQALQVSAQSVGGDEIGTAGLHLEQGAQCFDTVGLDRSIVEELRPPGDGLFQQYGVGGFAGRWIFRQFQEIGKKVAVQGVAEGEDDIHVFHGARDISPAEPEACCFHLDVHAARGQLRGSLHGQPGFGKIAAFFLEPGKRSVGGAIGRIVADCGGEVVDCPGRVRPGAAKSLREKGLRVGAVPA